MPSHFCLYLLKLVSCHIDLVYGLPSDCLRVSFPSAVASHFRNENNLQASRTVSPLYTPSRTSTHAHTKMFYCRRSPFPSFLASLLPFHCFFTMGSYMIPCLLVCVYCPCNSAFSPTRVIDLSFFLLRPPSTMKRSRSPRIAPLPVPHQDINEFQQRVALPCHFHIASHLISSHRIASLRPAKKEYKRNNGTTSTVTL